MFFVNHKDIINSMMDKEDNLMKKNLLKIQLLQSQQYEKKIKFGDQVVQRE